MNPQDQELVEAVVKAVLSAMNPQSKDWIDIIAALSPFVIGIAIAIVALFQWNTNRNRLKLELFERRYDVYTTTVKFINDVIIDRELIRPERLKDFKQATDKSYFLFKGKKINSALDKLHRKTNKLVAIIHERNQMLETPEINEERRREYSNSITNSKT
ncbi:hypothetical protein N9219_05375 [bacterium]|nr:hypothetical protein [bacterium]